MGSTPIKSSAKWNAKVGGQNYGGTSPAEMARRNAAYSLASVEASGLDARVNAALVSYGLPNVGAYMAAARECNKTIKKHSGPMLIAVLTAIANKWADAMGLDLTILQAMILSVFGITLSSIPPVPPDPTCFAGPDDSVIVGLPYNLVAATAADYSSILWTTSGDGVFIDPTVVNADYFPGINDIIAGTVGLTINAYAIPPNINDKSDLMDLTILTPAPLTAPVTLVPFIKSAFGPVSVPVRVANFVAVGAASLTVNYDPAFLTFLGGVGNPVIAGMLILNPVPGKILIAAVDPGAGWTLPDNSILVTLNFTYVIGVSPVTFSNVPTECEYSGPGPAYNVYPAVPFTDYWVNGSVNNL